MRMRLALLFAFLASGQASLTAAEQAAAKPSFDKDMIPFLRKHCLRCHAGEDPDSGVTLAVFAADKTASKDRDLWQKVHGMLESGKMPPEDEPRPDPRDVAVALRWLDAEALAVDCDQKNFAGRVTIRRLNRSEYNNTIRDLVGVDFHPAADFPADDVGYGFDNIGDVLTLSPIHLEKYLAAAGEIVEKAFADPSTRDRIMVCRPTKERPKEQCAREILKCFATRAYRRPVRDDELGRLVRLAMLAEERAGSFEQGVRVALQAVLVSPHFLFRIEEPAKDGPTPTTEYELATRLSYFLWSSMPDEELFRLARKGTLRKNLELQVRRMLKDPKSQALVDNFAGQWLQLRKLESVTPDRSVFPQFDEKLREAMRTETEMFFEAVMREDRSVLEFLDADFTFLNERLARHYGIEGVKGKQFRRVGLDDAERGGVLTNASILTITSNPNRTSPVKRGKWILEEILGAPPPAPPPNVPQLSEEKEVVQSASLRDRLELHRSKPECAVCHNQMDALGFGFENYDAIGAWRTNDGSFLVDASGTLPSGQSFDGPEELKGILKGSAEKFCRCLAEKMLTFGLGRGLEYYDKCAIDDVWKRLQGNDYRFSSLVLGIVESDSFQLKATRGVEE